MRSNTLIDETTGTVAHEIGRQIQASDGRIGVICGHPLRYDFEADNAFFTRPLGMPYRAKSDLVGGHQLIAATVWHRQADGGYKGAWVDSPLNTTLTAVLL